jgi:hypothetical protein
LASRCRASLHQPASSCAGEAAYRSGGGAVAEQAAVVEELGDLDGVECGALAQVVADDEEVEGERVVEVATQAADSHLVTARVVERCRQRVEDHVGERTSAATARSRSGSRSNVARSSTA